MKKEKSLEVAVLTGQLLMANGAEAYRVEETMAHILSVYYPGKNGVYATPTGIFASIIAEDEKPITLVKSVRARSTNLYVIDQLNQLSREFVAGNITLEVLSESVETLSDSKRGNPYSWAKYLLIYGLIPFFMVLLYKGSFINSLFAFAIGIGMGLFGKIKRIAKQGVLVQNVVMSFFPSFIANSLAVFGLTQNADVIVISCLMLLVPGVALTNSIRDIIAGDYLSGAARALEALLVGFAIAIGSGFGIGAAQLWKGWV